MQKLVRNLIVSVTWLSVGASMAAALPAHDPVSMIGGGPIVLIRGGGMGGGGGGMAGGGGGGMAASGGGGMGSAGLSSGSGMMASRDVQSDSGGSLRSERDSACKTSFFENLLWPERRALCEAQRLAAVRNGGKAR
jgi:hypothetical protein